MTPTLFDSPPVRHDHPHTSHAAAAQIAPAAGTLRERVYGYIVACGAFGATDEQIQDALEMNPSTQRPRRIELLTGGYIFDTGQTRATKSGRSAIIWRAWA